jgi:hypothetical protein
MIQIYLLDIPIDIIDEHLICFFTFQDMGKLIMTSNKCKKIFDSKDIWRKIYMMTLPWNWKILPTSIHLNYRNPQSEPCQEIPCDNISHYIANTLLSPTKKPYNYDYKTKILNKTHLNDPKIKKIFLNQKVIPLVLEWYDIKGQHTMWSERI